MYFQSDGELYTESTTMNGSALVGLTIIGCGLILLALVTPGWVGIDIKAPTEDEYVDMSMNPFYARVCEGLEFYEGCEIVFIANVIFNGNDTYSKYMDMSVDRYKERMAEAILCFICIIIGGILALVFGSSIRKTQGGTRGSSTSLMVTGLVFSIIGWIFGAILAVEFIIVHVRFEEKKPLIDAEVSAVSPVSDVQIDFEVPYSLIIMCIGLFIEFFAVIVHIAVMRTNYRAMPVNGMMLSPSTNGSSNVVIQQSITSSTPYARFA